MSEWIGWHFSTGVLGHGDGRPIRAGETYRVPGPPVLCEHGLHASRRALDALCYATGAIVSRVLLRGEIVEGRDKACATERPVLWVADATRTLYEFARWCAGREDAGEATHEEWAAAWAAALSAAFNAARRAAGRDGRAGAAWAAARDAQNAELERRLLALAPDRVGEDGR